MATAPSIDDDDEAGDNVAPPTKVSRRGWRFALGRGLVVLLVTLVAALVIGWFERERIARDLIGQELARLGIPATYDIERLDAEGQILSDIVIGDAEAPDLTVERVIVDLAFGFGVPKIDSVTLIRPRLYGNYADDGLTFGALDPLLFGEDDGGELPSFELAVRDGRARIDSAFGNVGVKLDGTGRLDRRFAGTLAAVGPRLAVDDCEASDASAYGAFAYTPKQFALDGPLRIAAARCTGAGIAMRRLAWDVDAALALDTLALRAEGRMAGGRSMAGSTGLRAFAGPVSLSYSDGRLLSRFDVTGRGLQSAQGTVETIDLTGILRAADGFARLESDVDYAARGIVPDTDIARSFDTAAQAAQGTLVAPLLRRMGPALVREARGSRLRGSAIVRLSDRALSVVAPQATLRNAGGQPVLALSRLSYAKMGEGLPRLSGNFRLSGRDLPRIAGRMEQDGGQATFRMTMQDYVAGGSRLGIPELRVTQNARGYDFDGTIVASGPLPGGAARELRLPIQGRYAADGALTLWRSCTDIAFDRLSYANLTIDKRVLTLCPAPGKPILRYAGGQLTLAAGAPRLAIAGTLAGTPVRLTSGAAGFAYPGSASIRDLSVILGPRDGAVRFDIAGLKADFGRDIRGTFDNADIAITAVPLDLRETQGTWRYADGVLAIDDATFTLFDRAETDRFVPLPATGGTLRLENDVITAGARMLAPTDARPVADVAITHNLSAGAGFADLDVPGLVFDRALQPDMLAPALLGVVANVDGTVTGTGRIDWNGDGVTSSGAFRSNGLDLAAAFGPVRGASGTVRFTDLLGLTTATDQRIAVASINPGIEVNDGSVAFSLREGQFLGVTGGTWPFMGGTLYLRPVELNLGMAERRRYLLEVEGLDAAQFVDSLELGNIAASGIFDGAMPLVFDEEGFGRIEGGRLVSRPPGGNVSYVGELTYEDLTPIVNYAFQTLRSLDYERMQISVDGPLTGDILTRLQFDGVTQGPGTLSNFITRRIAKLPIRFNVNIRAPFYKLMGSLRSIYDPAAVRDPRELGLLGDDGTRFVPVTPSTTQTVPPADRQPIQTPDSEDMP
ncbi:MAG: YdbH domain-containing protein [Pontixanthobacter sp.]